MRYLLSFFLICALSGSAQSDSLNLVNGLHLLHKQERTQFTLPLQSRVSIRMKDGGKLKGRLEEVTSEHLTVNGQQLKYQDIFFVGHRRFITDAGGVLLTVAGAGLLVAAILPIIGSGGGDGIVTSGLLGLSGVGIGIMGPGLIRDGKRYYLDDDWKVIPQ